MQRLALINIRNQISHTGGNDPIQRAVVQIHDAFRQFRFIARSQPVDHQNRSPRDTSECLFELCAGNRSPITVEMNHRSGNAVELLMWKIVGIKPVVRLFDMTGKINVGPVHGTCGQTVNHTRIACALRFKRNLGQDSFVFKLRLIRSSGQVYCRHNRSSYLMKHININRFPPQTIASEKNQGVL